MVVFIRPVGACFQLYDRRNEVVVLEVPAQPGDQLRLEIEHSFEHIPWFEYYTVMPDGSFNLDVIAVAGYGAGIPAEIDVPTRIENGLVWMEEINSNFPAFKWLTSDTYMKGLTLNGEEIFDFRTLPNASLIRGSIIMRRGVSLPMAEIERTTAEPETVDAVKGAEILEKYEKESRTRRFEWKLLVKIVYCLCLFFTVYHLAFASGVRLLQMVNIKHHAIHVGLVLVLGFALYPAFKKSSRKKIAWYDRICIALSAAMPIYVFYRYLDWISTGFKPTNLDLVMGAILIFLVLECSRRISGPALTILSIIFLLYGHYGRYFPGIFQNRGYTWERIIQYLTCDISGIYGTSVKVAATFIVLFIIFGEVMNKCGMGQFFNDIANALAGHTKGGPAKVAVLASGFLGSINGSAVANVVTTGAFTIPLMKKTGYSKEFAGAVEATASVGGQLLPPSWAPLPSSWRRPWACSTPLSSRPPSCPP